MTRHHSLLKDEGVDWALVALWGGLEIKRHMKSDWKREEDFESDRVHRRPICIAE